MTLPAIFATLLGWAIWLVRSLLFVGRPIMTTTLSMFSPAWLLAALGLVSMVLASPAKAGGFWGPDPKVEAANRALQQAAEIATEAAKNQASQQGQLLAAVEALSNERTQLAGHLTHLGEMAARDSAWAAALQAAGPVLVTVAVLALGCMAIWLVTRSSDQDARLASVLVDEIAGTGPGVLGGPASEGPSLRERIDIYSSKDIYSGSKPETPAGIHHHQLQTQRQNHPQNQDHNHDQEEGELPF
jgi:hypothetical protein